MEMALIFGGLVKLMKPKSHRSGILYYPKKPSEIESARRHDNETTAAASMSEDLGKTLTSKAISGNFL